MAIQQAVSQSLFSYWNALRGLRRAPKRFEIEPSRIAHNLPDAFVLERIDPTNVRFRLAGSRITDTLGMDLRGKNLFLLFDVADGRTLQNLLAVVVEHCGVGIFRMSAENARGATITLEVLVLPLTHLHNTVDRFLGAITPLDNPAWLGTEALTAFKLIDHEIIWPESQPSAVDDNGMPTSAQPPVIHSRRGARIVRSAQRQFLVYDGGLVDSVKDEVISR